MRKGQIVDDRVATRMRDDEREVQNGGKKMDSPPPYNWINRRFVARPASQLLFTRCRYPPRGGAMMYVARDLYLFREDILNERKGGQSDFCIRYSYLWIVSLLRGSISGYYARLTGIICKSSPHEVSFEPFALVVDSSRENQYLS